MSNLLLTSIALLALQTVRPAQVDPRQEPQGGWVLHLYDVRDLAGTLSADFPAFELGRIRPAQANAAEESTAGETTAGSTLARPAADGSADVLAIERGARALGEIVSAYLDPPLSGDPVERVTCSKAGTLVANLRPSQQDWVEQFLTGLRTFDGTIEIHARIFSAPSGVLREWQLTPSAVLATPAEIAALDERIRADGRFEQLNAPTLQVLPCQRANIAVTNRVSFVQDWTVEIVEPGGREIADPQIAVIDEGVSLEARATPLADGTLGIELKVQQAEVERPIRTEKVRIGSSSPQDVELALPAVSTQRFNTRLRLADGAGAVLVGAGTRDGTELAVVVTARRIARTTGPEHR